MARIIEGPVAVESVGVERYVGFWMDCLRPDSCRLLTVLECNGVWDMFISSPEYPSTRMI